MTDWQEEAEIGPIADLMHELDVLRSQRRDNAEKFLRYYQFVPPKVTRLTKLKRLWTRKTSRVRRVIALRIYRFWEDD